ncbi:SDR family NAD(P)-dependent oxidoreductase [Spirosoma rhododendri]|uniref:SDR family oxidoreductase n=1 Tax=Spirosoma rhododendri TaxID=2728024 RepID=A0A7L5DSN3_9BACT|nr:SDR family oxidoreductase [Spirosoma rhododendri]QJD78977.1 SDR family oxidoreductase [Spirosoma rhododendri]
MTTEVGKSVLITGASSGIGKELATLFARDGYHLILVSRSEDRLQTVADEFNRQYGTSSTVIEKDLSKPDSAQQVYDEVNRQGLTVNVLVNNAGVGAHGLFATETNLQKELDIIQLNVTTLVQLTKLFVRDMVARNEGKVLNLASIASTMPNPLVAIYGATKAFVLSFSEALYNELKDSNVTVTALLPPATDTDWFNKAGAENTVVAQGDLADPAKVAKDGYEALMAGKDKVISGASTKLAAAMASVLPSQQSANASRKQMSPPSEKSDSSSANLVIGIGVAALVATGVVAAIMYRNANPLEKAKYRYKWKRALGTVQDIAQSAVKQASDAKSKVQSQVSDLGDEVTSKAQALKAKAKAEQLKYKVKRKVADIDDASIGSMVMD